jgi:hypothetical protein
MEVQEMLHELKGHKNFFDETGRGIARVRDIGEALHAIGGVKLMDEIVDQVDDSIEYVWDGIGDFEVKCHRDKSNAPRIVGNWGTSEMKTPRTPNDPLGFVRVLFYERNLQWLKDNIAYDGEPSGNDTYGFMNCRNSAKELAEKGVIVQMKGKKSYPDLIL